FYFRGLFCAVRTIWGSSKRDPAFWRSYNDMVSFTKRLTLQKEQYGLRVEKCKKRGIIMAKNEREE
ncbi:MAG: hypothetical protein MJ070_11405, partial [Lachnospiraceae bacterium]|nr:hypothetical protein [Lachnospiraceae bacterium]